MKTSAKVFIWIGMIIQFYLIYPIIVGIFALKKLDEAQTKEELQTMGILTTFLCSVLGGIFMLSIKNEELALTENVVVTKTKVIEKEKSKTDTNQKTKKIITLCFFGIAFTLMMISLFFSISAVVNYYGTTYIPLILNSVGLVVLIIAFILYLKNKRFFNIPTYVLLLIFIFVSIAQIPISLISNGELASSMYWTSEYNEITHHLLRYRHYSYWSSWEYWAIFGICCFLIITSSLVLIYNYITRKAKINQKKGEVKQVKYVTKSNVEIELLEVQRLFDNKIITEEEYNRMRSSVISKYYK